MVRMVTMVRMVRMVEIFYDVRVSRTCFLISRRRSKPQCGSINLCNPFARSAGIFLEGARGRGTAHRGFLACLGRFKGGLRSVTLLREALVYF